MLSLMNIANLAEKKWEFVRDCKFKNIKKLINCYLKLTALVGLLDNALLNVVHWFCRNANLFSKRRIVR